MTSGALNDPSNPQPVSRFGTTRWSMVLRAGDAAREDSHQALSELVQIYWYPLYAFARRLGSNHHDALDLTQGFFAHLLSGQGLGTVSPSYGRFRSFLIAAFKNFMANEHRARETLRRGGSVNIISLNANEFESRYDHEPMHEETPDILFQRQWVETLLDRVRRRLAEAYANAGKAELFRLLQPYLTFQGEALTRAEIGVKLQLSQAAVAMSIHRMRQHYGELLREEVAATVDDPADVNDELLALMNLVGQP